MEKSKIKIHATIAFKQKKEVEELMECVLTSPVQKKDTDRITKLVKQLFEEKLCRLVRAKTRIRKNEVVVYLTIKPNDDDDIPDSIVPLERP